MRILSIEARDFLSYPVLELDLADIPHAAIIGRNGAGKSAILDAVLWCLYAQGRGSTDEMVRDGAVDCYVRTTWSRTVNRQTETVTITRSRSKVSDESSLTITVDGEDRSAVRIPDTQHRIERMVGMRYKAMLAGPVMVQGQSGAVLQAKPAEATDLLMELFQLERWAEYHEETKRRRDGLEAEAKLLQSRIADIDEELARDDVLAYEREIRQYTLIRDESQALVDAVSVELQEKRTEAAILQDRARRAEALGAEVDAALQQWSDLQDREWDIKNRIEQAQLVIKDSRIPDIPDAPDDAAIETLRSESDQRRDTIATMTSERSRIPDLERRLALAEQRAAEQSPCEGNPPGCRYLVLATDAAAEADGLRESINRVASSTRGLEAALAQQREAEVNIRSMASELNAQRQVREQVVAIAEQGKAKLAAAQQYLAENVPGLDALAAAIAKAAEHHQAKVKERVGLQQDEFAMAAMATEITDMTERLSEARTQLAAAESLVATDQQLIANHKAKQELRAEHAATLAASDDDRRTLGHLVKAFHRTGIPTDILDEALPEIEKRANEILTKLPDEYSIRIDTKVATKSQTFKDELRVVVMRAGRERPYHMLSGGQRFRVEFAFRIALAAVIAARVDATVDTLWLDEPLGPLDREGQEAVSDTLNAVRDDFGFIAVVSHVADFNDRFEHRIEVTMEDDESVACVR